MQYLTLEGEFCKGGGTQTPGLPPCLRFRPRSLVPAEDGKPNWTPTSAKPPGVVILAQGHELSTSPERADRPKGQSALHSGYRRSRAGPVPGRRAGASIPARAGARRPRHRRHSIWKFFHSHWEIRKIFWDCCHIARIRDYFRKKLSNKHVRLRGVHTGWKVPSR